jgi:hypothetical protein
MNLPVEWEWRSAFSEAEQAMTVEQQRQADLGQQALRALERDLPRLCQKRPGQWVAYQGECPLGFAAHKHELYHQCFDQGLARGEFVIFCIEPLETEMYIGRCSMRMSGIPLQK